MRITQSGRKQKIFELPEQPQPNLVIAKTVSYMEPQLVESKQS